MNLSLLLIAIHVIMIIISSAQTCPTESSLTYTYCSKEGGTCTLPSTGARAGYISYGANGRFTIIPFTNKGSGTLSFTCDNDFGDIIPGTVKYCCYYASDSDTEYTSTPLSGGSESEYESIDFGSIDSSATFLVNYGYDAREFYRPVYNAEVECGNDFFNDPYYGIVKDCRYEETSLVPDADSSVWTYCGAEYNSCTGIDTTISEPIWVRYGESSQYYFKLVFSESDGYIPCSNGFFEDPIVGTVKNCWYASTYSSMWKSRPANVVNARINGLFGYHLSKNINYAQILAIVMSICGVIFAVWYYYRLQRKKLGYERIPAMDSA